MMRRLWTANRRRVPLKYAIVAALVAVVGVLAIETAGTALTSSYKGLGGKLGGGPSAVMPARTPAE